MPAPLSVGKVVVGAFMVPWWKRRAFARALAVPLAALATLTLSWYYTAEMLPTFANWLLCLLYAGLFTLFAVRCHRLVLIDSESAVVPLRPEWAWRESRFLMWMIGLWLIYVATWWVSMILTGTVTANVWRNSPAESSVWLEWGISLGKVPALYVLARLSLVFPATAIDRIADLRWAWRLTEKNGWRLVVVVGVLPWVISYLLGLLYRGEPSLLETMVLTTVGIALFAVEIAALSISYRELTKDHDTAPVAQP